MSEDSKENIRNFLKGIGEDPDREGLKDTPKRVSESWTWLTGGRDEDPRGLIANSLYPADQDEMIVVKDITFYSMCEHHLLPFFGKAHVAYIPKGKIVGISKLPRMVELFARRLQIQERLTHEIASTLMNVLNPIGVAVVIEARHLCMEMRGIKKVGSKILTSSMLGAFRKNPATRAEFMSLIDKG